MNLYMHAFQLVMEHIKEYHDWPMSGKGIKYVDTNYDQRTMSFFRVVFRRSDQQQKLFTTVNRHDNPCTTSLQDEIMEWLDDPDAEWDKLEL